ncbi:uncharacterized protein LOC144629718 [Oculina patagonica]
MSTSIAIVILSPVAVAGNALVLAAIWRNPSLRTPSYILLTGLAITDFSTGLISQPFYVAMELIQLADPQLKTVVNRQTSFIITAIGKGSATYFIPVTTSIIAVMSIERWLHMTRRSLLTVRRVTYTVAGLFLLSIPIVAYRVLAILNNTIFSPVIDIASLSFLLFCLIVTSVAYFKVFRIIRTHQRQIQANYLSQASGQPAINFSKYEKSVFTILYILAIFYVSYFPTAIAFGLYLFWGNKYISATKPLFNLSMVFLFLSSSLNPILYLWRMSDIRNEVTSLVKGKLCKVN